MPTLRNQVSAAAAAAAPTAIAASQALGAAGPLVLTASPVNVGPAQQPVIITSAGNDSAIHFTISGTDYGGSPISEVLAGANAAAATSALQYSSVSSIVASGAVASTVEAGTAAAGYSPWLILGAQRNNYTTNLRAVITGVSATFEVEATSDVNIMKNTGGYADDVAVLVASGSVSVTTGVLEPWMAVRLKVTAGGPVSLRAMESRTA